MAGIAPNHANSPRVAIAEAHRRKHRRKTGARPARIDQVSGVVRQNPPTSMSGASPSTTTRSRSAATPTPGDTRKRQPCSGAVPATTDRTRLGGDRLASQTKAARRVPGRHGCLSRNMAGCGPKNRVREQFPLIFPFRLLPRPSGAPQPHTPLRHCLDLVFEPARSDHEFVIRRVAYLVDHVGIELVTE